MWSGQLFYYTYFIHLLCIIWFSIICVFFFFLVFHLRNINIQYEILEYLFYFSFPKSFFKSIKIESIIYRYHEWIERTC